MSGMIETIKDRIKSTSLAYFFIELKSFFTKPRAQNDEEFIIHRLTHRYEIPQTFIEFGFSGWEFNCARLVNDWDGLLVDGDDYNIKIAKTILGKNITVKKAWLTLDDLDFFSEWLDSKALGILSVDVDGNDYWFLEKLISLKPALIIAEYNSSFGLSPLTVEYDPDFDRTKKHPTWTYFGASLTALHFLAEKNGYSLIEISNSGINAFFIRNDLLSYQDIVLKPDCAFREKIFGDGSRPAEQFKRIKHLPFVDVTESIYHNSE
jgi:hypothetical protein